MFDQMKIQDNIIVTFIFTQCKNKINLKHNNGCNDLCQGQIQP